MVSAATALIPFLEHDDANRALMGSNMQRQAVPLVAPRPRSSAPAWSTAPRSTPVTSSWPRRPVSSPRSRRPGHRRHDDGTYRTYRIAKFTAPTRATATTSASSSPRATGRGRGRSSPTAPRPTVARWPWAQPARGVHAVGGPQLRGRDHPVQRLVQDDVLSSIHIEEHEVDARDTKLGPEEITRDIPNVSEEVLADLDERGIIRIGAEVRDGDLLVGKVTPKGETELTPEERLLRAIFGEKAREVRDTSLKVPHGETGTVIGVKVFDKDDGDELPPGVNQLVRVYVANKRKITDGDKLAGRHGNKGVISKILPVEDMPFLEDGTPVDVVLNPLGVPGRMNIGQILELHLGWAASRGWEIDGTRSGPRTSRRGPSAPSPAPVSPRPVFDGAREDEIIGLLDSTRQDPRRRAPHRRQRQGPAVRRSLRRAVPRAGVGGLHVHPQAAPPRGRQDPRALAPAPTR
jgi:DNA-directed RNA polymerase subunit beta